jgi:adenylate cyclase
MQVSVSNKAGMTRFEHAGGPLEFGREARPGTLRRVIDDPYLSKNQLRIEEIPGSRLRVENLSSKVAVRTTEGLSIAPGATHVLPLPVRFTVGMTLIDFEETAEAEADDAGALRTVARPDLRPGATFRVVQPGYDEDEGTERLALWFETLLSVQRAAASSLEFYHEIARAVVELIGLDYGLFLKRSGDRWTALARHPSGSTTLVEFSHTVLERVVRERRTFYQVADTSGGERSLAGVTAVVASPVFEAGDGAVIGVVYGARGGRAGNPTGAIRPLHAQLVQVLAAAATAGIARISSEAEAARRHVQFEQFFSRELAGELDRNPELLAGQDREVTVLVSDVRGFSRISERIGPRETCRLMGDVLERLTARIHEEGGVVVDYAGDGIMAMWNAPLEQPDHTVRACRAALAMLGEIPALNEQWGNLTGEPVGLGIGLNTGAALVGNVGSRQRLKYGAIGNTVNLASRVEGATKALGMPLLISGTTHALLGGSFAARRLCRARVVGIDTPVELYELHGQTATAEWLAARDAYEAALALFEAGRLSEACRALFPLLQDGDGRHDRPALTLAARAIDGLRTAAPFDPVIALDAK